MKCESCGRDTTKSGCRIVTDSLNFCHATKGLRANAYVVMPTHMHAIVFASDCDSERLQKSLMDFRKSGGG